MMVENRRVSDVREQASGIAFGMMFDYVSALFDDISTPALQTASAKWVKAHHLLNAAVAELHELEAFMEMNNLPTYEKPEAGDSDYTQKEN